MSKLTREEFRVLRTRAEHDLAQSREVPSILICAGTGCIAGGAMKIYDNFRSECEARELKVYVGLKHDSDEEKSLHVKMSGCHGFCEMGPLVHIEPMGVMYIHVKPEDCHEILEKTVLGGEVIDRLVYHLDGTAYPKQEDIPFYKKQHRVVLENCGTSDAEDIEEYIAKGGYAAFEKALFEMSDEDICREILDSGLRGRGGAGFPAGRKWDSVRRQPKGKKYVVCNGDEGDPGAFMDRSIMEGNPHSVLEAMAFRETGMREGHGNFTWAANSSSFFLWVVMTGVFLRSFAQDMRLGALRSVRGLGYAAVGGLFLWHAYSSVYYLHYLLTSTNAF